MSTLLRAALVALAVLLLSPAAGHAAFPAANGKIAFQRAGDIWTMNPDGTDQVNLTNTPAAEGAASWSADGNRIAFARRVGPQDELFVMFADGTGETPVPTSTDASDPAWSPDGNRLTYVSEQFPAVLKVNLDGTGEAVLFAGETPGGPAWSPDGSTIALHDYSGYPGCYYDIWTTDTDENTGDAFLVTCPGTGSNGAMNLWPNWSPEGTRIAYTSDSPCTACGPHYITTIDPDGTDRTTLSVDGTNPAWSPDGGKIVYGSSVGNRIKTVNADGTNIVDVAEGFHPDWQPLPINSYPRPKGATPFRASLTTAYNQCTAPDRTHGPPLGFPSCASPQKSSAHLTVGTGDSNGLPARNEGHLRLDVIVGVPGGPDDADVGLDFFMDDVFTNALVDYTGELRARVVLQITDKDNTPHPGGPGAATTTAIPLELTANCTPVADPQEGSACIATTTADALAPGTVKEGRRSIWELSRVEVYDGGPDGDAQTPAGDTLFATQGLFVP